MTASTELETKARPIAESIDHGAVAAIVSSSHGDPFSILGPHEVAPGVWDIRVFIPWGEKVELVGYHDDAVVAPFETLHPEGFRVARVESKERPG